MLTKYHNLPDHFHDLKTTLQAEFDLLKTSTLKNIQNIQEAVQSQQAYMTVLSGRINTLYTKLVHLDKQVQIHCMYPHPQSDAIQLNPPPPDYDPDIDGDPDPVTDVQPPNAKCDKEDTSTGTLKSEDHSTIHPFTNRPEHQPSEVLPDIDSNEYNNIEQQWAEHPSNYCPQLEDIPELETDKENWDDSLMMQSFYIIINLLRKVTEYIVSTLLTLKKLKTKNTALTIWHKESNTTSLNLIIITPIHNQNSTRDSKTKTYTYPHPPLSKTYVLGTVEAEEEPGISNYMATGCMVKKQGCWKAD